MYKNCLLVLLAFVISIVGFSCNSDDTIIDGDNTESDATDGDIDTDIEVLESDVEQEGTETETEQESDALSKLLPPRPLDKLGYNRPLRSPSGVAPNTLEITEFTNTLNSFFKNTGYFDWVWRVSHGLHKTYDPKMMDYKLWWQDVGMRREGNKVILYHQGIAENIAERTMKVLPNTIAGYLLTGNSRMADISLQYMKGMVALSKGLEFEREEPVVKYLQSRSVFNHNHSYTVDDRLLEIDYTPSCVTSAKWNVHVFEIPDNPTFGNIWVSNMRSKDDIPYVYQSMTMATRLYYETDDLAMREAALLYIEYLRGFAKSIVDNDWYILTKYADGKAVKMYDIDSEGQPEADLGSFVHWTGIFGEDAECNAQLGAALTAYGDPYGKGDCGRGLAGSNFEKLVFATHFFNYEIYVHFHIGALAAANLWQKNDIAEKLMSGLVDRFDSLMHDDKLAHRDDIDFDSALAGWLLVAATHGYPLTGDEAHHIQKWYASSAEWYSKWSHWDPWNSLEDGEDLSDYKAPNRETVTEGGEDHTIGYIRMMEMPYVFEYCASPLRDKEGVQFVDCEAISSFKL